MSRSWIRVCSRAAAIAVTASSALTMPARTAAAEPDEVELRVAGPGSTPRPSAAHRWWLDTKVQAELGWTRLSLSRPWTEEDGGQRPTPAWVLGLDPLAADIAGLPEVGGSLASAVTSLFTDGLVLRSRGLALQRPHLHRLRLYLGQQGARLAWRVEF